MTFADWPWRHWGNIQRDKTALIIDDLPLTWQALCQRVDRLAAGFIAQGVREGDGVALRAANSPSVLLAWLALMQSGARILPINPKLPAMLLGELLPAMTLRFALDLAGDAMTLNFTPLTLCESHESDAVQVPWRADRLVSMTLTSGSSGLPKAAVHTPEAHLASAEGVLTLMPFRHGDNWLLSLPLFHVSGQGILWRWLLAGATITVRDLHPLHQALAGCTHASLVPTQLWRLLTQSLLPKSLTHVLLGGAAIPVELSKEAEARGVNCWCGYGLTEFASTVCAKRADGLPDVGYALAGREVKLIEGESLLRARSMASGYWRNGKLAALSDEDGWFHTRDRGALEQGKLTVIGRLDNLFFSGGEGIQPEDVERVIVRHPEVSQCFVVPIADAEFGQRPVAVVECAQALIPESLAIWATDKLAGFQLPVRWLRLPQALANGGIKISRREVQRWVAAGGQDAP